MKLSYGPNPIAPSVCEHFSVCISLCNLTMLCPQDRLFALEEESIESGRGRSPYDPNSPCTSTLSSKTLFTTLALVTLTKR